MERDESQKNGREDRDLGGNGGEDGRQDSERPLAENLERTLEGNGCGRPRRRTKKQSQHASSSQRGGIFWDASGAIEDSQGLPKPCAMVLANLSSQSNLLVPETPNILDSQSHHDILVDIKNMLSGESWKESQIVFQVNSLKNIILRCQRAERVEAGVQFISMVNLIQLAAKVERYVYSFKLQVLTVLLNLHALAFENLENSTVERKSYAENCQKEVIQVFMNEPCRSGCLLEQNLQLWLVQVSVSYVFQKRCLISLFFFQDPFTC